ncbi:hypothetical protein QR685DRAFT_574993 [Neurospora intermedia]|uniref:Uncharacterized protein n=1 Tax=Neurospora intermedia TaxID=5142 RepID=A0ABR3D2J8_NEUIN
MVVSPFRVVVGTYTSAQRSKPRRQAKTGNGFYRSACVINEELIRRMILVNLTSSGGDRLELSPRKDRGKDDQSSRADEEVKEGKSRAFAQAQAIYGKLLLHHAACTVTTANPDWLRLLDVEREWTEERMERVKGAPWERCSMSRKRRSRRPAFRRILNGWPTRSINLACNPNAAVLYEHACCCQLLPCRLCRLRSPDPIGSS